ncbi:hypothetical protein [Chromobacterium haemolyticum]|uniref:hypothetical protein n=1 Tax=Chromobacterium haemolyticum TaxID=394935 RepID=UPI002448F68B|nr:hypothetical protein [Chromobacterium haemolyticum]MDH0342010.1 hypothetical protein [Chromobacterium haemolyticum]
MANADDMLLIEVALRDSRHLDVIMALDRLVILPETEDALQAAMRDLEKVRTFINEHLPERLRATAKAMFVEHGRQVEGHFRAAQSK